MGLEKVGVSAVVENIGNYLSDMNKLNKATGDSSASMEKASKSSEAMSKALAGIGKVVAGLGLTSLFAGMVKSASDSEDAIAALDAVLKSTKNAVVGMGDATGKTSANMEMWTKGLEEAQKKMSDLQAKVAAGIQLSKEESQALVDAGQEAVKYQAAIDNAAKSQQGLTDKTTAGVKVQHMSRDALLDMASALQKVTRFSDETIISGESMLLTFTNIGKDVFPRATRAVLDYAAKFGNVEQAAIAIGKALQDPITGVTNLRRVGVMLSKQQEDQIKKFVAVGKVAEAQAIILKELETEFGGLAVAAGKTFAGKLDILKNKFDDVLEVAGGKLIPVLSKLLDVVSGLIDGLGDAAPILLIFAAGLGAISLAAGPLGTALAIILSPIGAIVAAIVGLGLAFQSNFLGFKDFVLGIWDTIKGPLTGIKDAIVNVFSTLFGGGNIGINLQPALENLGWQLKHGLELMLSGLGIDYRIVQKVIDVITGPLADGIRGFIGALSGADFGGASQILNIIGNAFATLVNVVGEVVIAGLKAIGSVLPILGAALSNFINAVSLLSQGDILGFLRGIGDGLFKIAQAALMFPLTLAAQLGILGPIVDFLNQAVTSAGQLVTIVRDGLSAALAGLDKTTFGYLAVGAAAFVAVFTVSRIVTIVGDLITGIKGLAAGMGLLNLSMGPIGLVLGAIAVITLAVSSNFLGLGDRVRELGQTFEKAYTSAVKIHDALKALMDFFNNNAQARELLNNPFNKYSAGNNPNLPPSMYGGYNTYTSVAVPTRASGGPANGLTLVGEHGPELVTFGQPGFVFPNSVSQMLSGLMAQASPAPAMASSYAYNNTYNQQQSVGDINFHGVQGTDDSIRRYALLRALGRIR